MNPDGSNPVDLALAPAVDDRHASYSGNGKKMAYDSEVGGNNQEIYTLKANGLLQTRLTHNNLFDAQPSLSPDGKKIAFTSNRPQDFDFEVFRMDSVDANHDHQGDHPTNLTNFPGQDS